MPVKKRTTRTNINMPPIKAVSEKETTLAVLAYGRSGTGKTTFSSSFPKPLLLLDIRERGTDSIANVRGVDVAEVTRWEEFEEVYWFLSRGTKYKTIVIDQVSQLQDLAMERAMEDAGKKWGETPSRRDFGGAASLMKTWMLNYRDLIDEGVNIVFLAHDRESDTEEADDSQIMPTIGPRVMPSVGSFLTGAVKIIGYTFIQERFPIINKRKQRVVEYAMRIGPHAIYTTKTRSPVGIESPELLIDPTYEKLVAIVKGTYETAITKPKRKVK